MAKSPDQIAFDIVADGTDDPVATARITTPDGNLMLMAELEIQGRTLILTGVHVQGDGPNTIGPMTLRRIADAVMERMDLDEIEAQGASRTTGAGPGRTPHPIRFRRRRDAEAER